jgi:cobalt-zinc-cadmium efflux system protein
LGHLSTRFQVAIALTLGFVVLEAVAGLYSNSLALLSDAAHNLSDVLALGLSLYALYLSTHPSNATKTFGYHRAGILAALCNSIALVVISLGIFYEAYQRLLLPPQVEENVLIVVAAIAFVVNAGTAWLIKQGSEHDLNVRSAFVHLAGDAVSTLGAVLAGIGIRLTGLQILDPLASLLISVMIAWSAWGILREGIHILLEGTPRGIDLDAMARDLLQVPGVLGVHDLHAWSITSSVHALSAHVVTDDIPLSDGAGIQRAINEMLVARYNIAHTALQLECEGCIPDALYCKLGNGSDPVAANRPAEDSTRGARPHHQKRKL